MNELLKTLSTASGARVFFYGVVFLITVALVTQFILSIIRIFKNKE